MTTVDDILHGTHHRTRQDHLHQVITMMTIEITVETTNPVVGVSSVGTLGASTSVLLRRNGQITRVTQVGEDSEVTSTGRTGG